jgi:hypothetical protein
VVQQHCARHGNGGADSLIQLGSVLAYQLVPEDSQSATSDGLPRVNSYAELWRDSTQVFAHAILNCWVKLFRCDNVRSWEALSITLGSCGWPAAPVLAHGKVVPTLHQCKPTCWG